MGAGCLSAYTAVRRLVFLGWPVTYVASKCSNLRPQIIFCSSFLLCMFDSVALFIFLKYFLLVCVSWLAPARIFLNAIFSDPFAIYNATPSPSPGMMASCLDGLHFPRLGRVLRTMMPPPLHLKGEGCWGPLLCKVGVSFADGPKRKKFDVCIFQPGFLTTDISRTDFLKLQLS